MNDEIHWFTIIFIIMILFILLSNANSKELILTQNDLYKYEINKLLNKQINIKINCNDIYYISKLENIGYIIRLKNGDKYLINNK